MAYQPYGVQELVKSPTSLETSVWVQFSHRHHISQLVQPQTAQKHALNSLGATEEATVRKRGDDRPSEKLARTTQCVPGQVPADGFVNTSLRRYCARHSLQGGTLHTRCVFLARLPSAEIRIGLKANFYFCKAEHGFLSYRIPLFSPHTGTEEKMHTIEPTKTKKLLIMHCFAVSVFITANIDGAGKQNNTWKLNLKPALDACIISSFRYRGDPLPCVEYTAQETATWWVCYFHSDSWAVPLQSQERLAMWDSYKFLKSHLSISNFTPWLRVTFWSFVLQKAILRAGLTYSLSRVKCIFLTTFLPANLVKIAEARKHPEPIVELLLTDL